MEIPLHICRCFTGSWAPHVEIFYQRLAPMHVVTFELILRTINADASWYIMYMGYESLILMCHV